MSADRVEWVWKGFRSDLGQKNTNKSKWKVYKRVVRPAMLFGLETVLLNKRQEAELKRLRFSLGAMRMDKMRNEHIRGTEQVRRL